MTAIPFRLWRRVPARRTLMGASVLALLGTLGVVLFATLRTPLKDDVAWLLYIADRWLTGQRLYIDLVEVNPPLIIWLSALPAMLAEWSGYAAKQIALPFFSAGVLGATWWSACILRGASAIFEDRLTTFALAGTVILGVAGPELGQREHLLVAAMLPYLCLFARSMDGERPGRAAAIAAGVLAGLGCALKPRYVLVCGVLECVALLWGLRPWRAMTLAAAATAIVYVAAVVVFYPAYLERAVPLALALYGATDVPFSAMVRDNIPVMLGEAGALLLWWINRRRMRESNLILTLAVFAVGSTLVCFMDGKNWFYHRLPATTTTILALLVWMGGTLSSPAARRHGQRVAVMAVSAAFVAFGAAAADRLRPQVKLACAPDLSTEARLEKLIRKEHAKTYVAFSEWITLGFPVVNNTGVVWASRFDSMWALKGELWRSRFDPATPREWPISRWVARDFVAGCPDLVVVDMREGLNYIAVLSKSDPAFAAAWSHYRMIRAFDGLQVYKHYGDGHCSGRSLLMQAQVVPSTHDPQEP